jgi:hypothetical protein
MVTRKKQEELHQTFRYRIKYFVIDFRFDPFFVTATLISYPVDLAVQGLGHI